MRMSDVLPYLYPRLYPMHTMTQECGTYNEGKGQFILPSPEILSSEKVSTGGVYLMHDYYTSTIYVWVGERCKPRLLYSLFGTERLTEEHVRSFADMLATARA